jgi:hypothetical protein
MGKRDRTIYLPDKEDTELTFLAARDNVSRSRKVREWIQADIEKIGKKED